jgi:enoyl-[acyl-carrier-protein] reductase (NADH)
MTLVFKCLNKVLKSIKSIDLKKCYIYLLMTEVIDKYQRGKIYKVLIMLMMKSIAQEVAPLRIRVNSIAPGAVRTPINTQAWNTPQAYSDLMQLVPYQRIGEPEDIGRAAAWIVSDYADYVTGTTLFVDGGMTLYPGFADGG